MRHFVNKTGSSNKFWSVNPISDTSCEVRWGRIGQEGQKPQIKEFSSSYAMQRFIEKKVAEKLGEGYTEVSQDNLQKEKETAQGLGSQYKINRMEFVANQMGKSFTFGKGYIPENGVVVEIVNSWSKDASYLFLTKKDSWRLDGVSFQGQGCTCTRMAEADEDSWVKTIRKVLRDIAQEVVKIATQAFAAVGTRSLNLGDDDEDQAAVQEVVSQAHKLSSASSVGDQLLLKFACMGARSLEL